MDHSTRQLIQKINEALQARIKQNALFPGKDHKVYVSPTAGRILGWGMLGALVFAGAIGVVSESAGAFFLIAGIFSIFVLPGLLATYHCWIRWDEEGFTVSRFWGNRRRYTYEDVTGICRLGLTLGIRTSDGRRVDLDSTFCNREEFFDAVCRHRKHLPQIPESVLGMGPEDQAFSYKRGVLRKAMLIPEEGGYRDGMRSHRALGLGISRTAFVLGSVSVLVMFLPGYEMDRILKLSGLITAAQLLLSIASLVLFIRYPQYYSARPRPEGNSVALDEECRAYHKWSPMTGSCRAAGFLIILHYFVITRFPLPGASVWILSLVLGSLSGILYYYIGKSHSQEYKAYGVGLVSLFSNSLFFGMCCAGAVLLVLLF